MFSTIQIDMIDGVTIESRRLYTLSFIMPITRNDCEIFPMFRQHAIEPRWKNSQPKMTLRNNKKNE